MKLLFYMELIKIMCWKRIQCLLKISINVLPFFCTFLPPLRYLQSLFPIHQHQINVHKLYCVSFLLKIVNKIRPALLIVANSSQYSLQNQVFVTAMLVYFTHIKLILCILFLGSLWEVLGSVGQCWCMIVSQL